MKTQFGIPQDCLPQMPESNRQAEAAVTVGDFLAFKLGDEEYGIDVWGVQEVRYFDAPTSIYNAPSHVLGVQKLRGVTVPIVDLRLRFGAIDACYDSLTVIVVINVANYVVGVVVDRVTDIVRLGSEQLRPAPELNSKFDSDQLMAVGFVNDRMLMLLDLEKLMISVESGTGFDALH